MIEPETQWELKRINISDTEEKLPEAGHVRFETGFLTPEEISQILNAIPGDMTFIDKNDTVKYFSQWRRFWKILKLVGRIARISGLKYNETIGYSSNEYLLEEQLKEEMGQVEATEGLTIINGILLVNKEYRLPMGYDPGPDPVAKEYLDKMIEACYEETGKKLIAFSGYRTYEYQKGLFDRYVEKDGYENAVLYSAKPRHSEHESGLAYDIGGSDQAYWLEEEFENTEEGIWLKKNSHRFAYILRYPKDKTHITGYIYEPWHFRYVGIEHATNIYERDITLEEYLQVYK